jgi:hypothetical protein
VISRRLPVRGQRTGECGLLALVGLVLTVVTTARSWRGVRARRG